MGSIAVGRLRLSQVASVSDPKTVAILLEAARRANWDAQHGPSHLRSGRFDMTTKSDRKPLDLNLAVEEGGDLWLQLTLSTGERWRLSIPRATLDEALAGPRPSPHYWSWSDHAVVIEASARARYHFERSRYRCKFDLWARLARPTVDRDNVWTCECLLCTGARLMHRTDAPPPSSPADAEKVRIRLEALRWKAPSGVRNEGDISALENAIPDGRPEDASQFGERDGQTVATPQEPLRRDPVVAEASLAAIDPPNLEAPPSEANADEALKVDDDSHRSS